jgi:hypothetical protein
MRSVLMVSVALVLIGCVDERTAWRADALDVSGDWQLTSPIIANAEVDIRTESDVNDIRMVLRRGDDAAAFSADEADVLQRLQGANDRLLVRTALELGTGIDAARTEIVGGENISLDGGISASVEVVSGAYAAATADTSTSLIRWGMSLAGDDNELRGVLFVTERVRSGSLGTSDTDLQTHRHDIDVVLRK